MNQIGTSPHVPSWYTSVMAKRPKKHPTVVYLAEHMADAGVGDKDLADAIGVDRVTVTRWRNGDRKFDFYYISAVRLN